MNLDWLECSKLSFIHDNFEHSRFAIWLGEDVSIIENIPSKTLVSVPNKSKVSIEFDFLG